MFATAGDHKFRVVKQYKFIILKLSGTNVQNGIP